LRELKPNRFEDLIAMNALYRPGPMDYIPKFISRKHGKSKIQYDLPVMEKYLKDTYGITVYQEQVMQLSVAMADFTRGEADSLRKAMGKKKKKEMDKLKEKFLEGSAKNNIDTKIAERVWHDWEAFAQYAFNKSHSTSYAYVAYRTAYLKAHYPSEYMAAVLSREINDIKRITQYMDESKRMGISVLGPDVNESNIKFTVNKEGNIRFGLGAIKGVGKNAATEIVNERKQNGPFKDVFDFVERVTLYAVNKKNLEALAVSGAFDNFDAIQREQYLAETNGGSSFVEELIRYGNRVSQEKNTSQQSLFGEVENFEFVKPVPPFVEEWSKVEKLKKEKELVGVYISAHPLDDFKFEINSFSNVTLNEMDDLKSQLGRDLSLCGIVSEFKTGISKNGKPYGFVTIQDYRESFRIALFNSDFLKYQQYFKVGLSLLIKGKVEASYYREGEFEFKVKSVHLLTEARDELVKSIQLTIPISIITPEFVDELEKVSSSKGNILFKFNIFDPGEKLSINLFSRSKRIKISDRFLDFVDHQPGIEIAVK
jgi:DNA polymerase-3 subunit alpha